MSVKPHNWIYLILFFITLSACYLPALTGHYIHHDDVFFWERSPQTYSPHAMFQTLLALGRYLSAYMATALGWIVVTVKDLNSVRWLSLLQIVLSAWFMFLCLCRHVDGRVKAFLVCFLIFVLPPFQVLVGYAQCAPLSSAVLFATISICLADQISIERALVKRIVCKRTLLAILLLMASYATYASAATFYWAVAAFIVLLNQRASYQALRHRVMNVCVVGMAALLGYVLVLNVTKTYFQKYTHGIYSPYMFTTDYMGKLKWFVAEPLVNTLNLWNIYPNLFVAFFALSVILGAWIYCFALEGDREEGGNENFVVRRSFFMAMVLGFIMVQSFLPNLVSVPNVAFYRVCVGLTSFMAFLFVWAMVQWVSIFPSSLRDKIYVGLLFLLCLYGGISAYGNLLNYIVRPNQAELEYVKEIVRGIDLTKYDQIHVLRPDEKAMKKRYDEFGHLTFGSPAQTRLFMDAVIRENQKDGIVDTDRFVFSVNAKHPDQSFEESTLVIDMTKVFNPKGEFSYLFMK